MEQEKYRAIVAVSNLSCRRGERPVLNQVEFSVREGEKVALVGENGAGKSTLLKCLNGLLSFQGSVSLFGEPIQSSSKRVLARKVAYLSQGHESFPDYSVIEFLKLSRYPFHGPFDRLSVDEERRIDEFLELSDLFELRERSLLDLSGGERQRVLLTGCFCQDPELLLLDEPVSYLDFAHQEKFYELLDRYCAHRTVTALIVGHDLNRATLWADRILCLKDGSISFDGSPTEFMRHDVLRENYDIEVALVSHPERGLPMVVPK